MYYMREKRKFFPFNRLDMERGESSLIFVGFIAAASFVGATSLIKRAVEDGKLAKIAERQANASQNPISAAIVAKSLFAAPGAWTTPNLVSNAALVPNLYIDPYIVPNTFSGALPSVRPMNPSAGGNTIWDSSQFATTGKIYVNTSDRNRLVAGTFDAMMSDAADGGYFQINNFKGVATTKTTISNFVTSHCTPPPNSMPSATFTGYYCVQADFSTDNYSQNNGPPSGANKSRVFLGGIQAPPVPRCDSVATVPSNVAPGDNVTINVRASGVVTGYTATIFNANGRELQSVNLSNVKTAADSVRSSGVIIPIGINMTNPSLFNYSTMPLDTIVKANVTLKGITGNAMVCSAQMVVRRPSCSLSFNKTSYVPGEQVTMTYRLNDSRPSDMAVYQPSNIAMNAATPGSPDGVWTFVGPAPAAPPGQSRNFSASVMLRRGGVLLNQCSASAVSQASPASCNIWRCQNTYAKTPGFYPTYHQPGCPGTATLYSGAIAHGVSMFKITHNAGGSGYFYSFNPAGEQVAGYWNNAATAPKVTCNNGAMP